MEYYIHLILTGSFLLVFLFFDFLVPVVMFKIFPCIPVVCHWKTKRKMAFQFSLLVASFVVYSKIMLLKLQTIFVDLGMGMCFKAPISLFVCIHHYGYIGTNKFHSKNISFIQKALRNYIEIKLFQIF